MREELKTLLLGIGVLLIGGLAFTFYQSLNLNQIKSPVVNEGGQTTTSTASDLPLNSNDLSILVGTTTLNIELATTSPQREQGLSNRESLPADTGLLFVFDKPGLYGFWMKEMNFAIDIIWLNQAGEIVEITKKATPGSYPHIFYPPAPVIYVLEVNAGYSDEHRLEVGDVLEPLL